MTAEIAKDIGVAALWFGGAGLLWVGFCFVMWKLEKKHG